MYMPQSSPITIEQSGAFVEVFSLEPTGEGPLSGLTFAVKDIIDIAGHRTGCGNPTWRDTHPAPRSHAVCVDQLLSAGARFVGKTVSDEVAFSLIGENHFYGTPLNPKAPDRVPGGSSSGSTSAVACGLADFALGTDTGGSVRVPASNCGIWGFRPSHGFISVAGVMPFAPAFDTVGVHARTADTLAKVGYVLLATVTESSAQPTNIHLLLDAFELAEPAVAGALQEPLDRIRQQFGPAVCETSLSDIAGTAEPSLEPWFDTYCVLQWGEIEDSLGGWIATCKPAFGPVTTKSFELVADLDRRRIAPAIARRERYFRALNQFLGPRDLICIPTVPAPAPLKGSLTVTQRSGAYYRRALSLTSIAGIGRLPQVSLPVAEVEGAPVGLSLLARHGEDAFLLSTALSAARQEL
jgi:amidase